MFREIITAPNGEEIEKREFDIFVECMLDEFSETEKQIYFGKPLSQLALLPFTSEIDLDFKNKKNSDNLKYAIYAQLENTKTVSKWIANQALNKIYHTETSILEGSPALSTWSFYSQLFDSKFYTPTVLNRIEKSEKQKDKLKYYHLINESKSLVDSIKRFMDYEKDHSLIPADLQKRLRKTKITQEIYKRTVSDKSKKLQFQLTFKDKTPLSIADKQSYEFAKKGYSSKQIPSFLLGSIGIRDYVGFQLVTNEVIDPYSPSFNNSMVSKVVEFYKTNPDIFVDYDVARDNYYLSESRKMNGIQMYLSPNTQAVNSGLEFPFKDIVGSLENLKDIYPVSFHLHGLGAFAGNQLGAYDVIPHEQFKVVSNNVRDDFYLTLPKNVQKLVKSSSDIFEDIFTFNSLYNSYLEY